jgi:uncharacterized protein (DUF433 family)
LDIENYFDRVTPDDILIRRTRVDVATVFDAYREGLSPEEIAYNYPTLTLEQVYATLTYYLAHREALDAAERGGQQPARASEPTSPEAPVIMRLRALATQRRAAPPGDEKSAASR